MFYIKLIYFSIFLYVLFKFESYRMNVVVMALEEYSYQEIGSFMSEGLKYSSILFIQIIIDKS